MTTLTPKAIIFDLLTALLDSWTIWSLSIPPNFPITGQTWRTEYLHLTYNHSGPYTPYESLVSQAARNVGLPAAQATQLLLDNIDAIVPWPEVPAVLATLHARGYRLGVVTNCSDALGRRIVGNTEQRVREATGREGFAFDAVVTAEESGFYKPNEKPYRDVLGKLGLEAEEALFVAGSAADVPGATGVGMRVVWNNHVGMTGKGGVRPLREGRDLVEALEDVLVDREGGA